MAGYETLKQSVVSSPSSIQELWLHDETKSPKLDLRMNPTEEREIMVTGPIISAFKSMGFEDSEVAKPKSYLHANDITSLELLIHVKDSSWAKWGFEPAQITRFRRAQYFDPIVAALKSMGFDETAATKLGCSLVMNDVTSMPLLMQADDDVLERSGFTPGNIAKFELGKSRLGPLPAATPVTLSLVVSQPPPSQDDSNLLFISYVKKDTVSENRCGVRSGQAKVSQS